MVSESTLMARARRAYELGRLRMAVSVSALVVPMAGLSLVCCNNTPATLAGAGLLAMLVAALVWRGEGFARGVKPGLLAGLPPLVMPVIIKLGVHPCFDGVCQLAQTACIAGGIAGGIMLVAFDYQRRESRRTTVVCALLIAGVAGSLGCMIGGIAGLVGMTIGMIAGAAPVLVRQRV
jgi:hypothetical protein